MERLLEGVSAAPGVAIGPAVVLDHATQTEWPTIPVAQRGAESARALAALTAAASELDSLAARLRDQGRSDEAEIIETGVLIAGDPGLIERVEGLVASGTPATEALRDAAEEMASVLESLADPMLAQRADDVRSLGRRAAARAAGADGRRGDGILVASTLGPADVAELAGGARAIALAGGGVTSHAAIVARSLGLPMVIGLGPEILDAGDGEELIVDGDRAIVIRRPSMSRAAAARDHAEQRRGAREIAIARRADPAVTRDGHRVRVLANASTVSELEEALRQGAEGVGLLRTELLFLEAPAWPSPEQQFRAVRPVLALLAGQVATVRLFDFGGDKTPPFLRGTAMRGIEILLDAPDMLRMHLESLVAAGRGTRLRILVPMVTTAEQMRAVRRAVARLAVAADAQFGAMIETPEAAAAATEIARECDFLSIGTNDLTQLTLGLDREQSRRAPVMDVRVLRLIAAATRAGTRAGIPVDVCGEAASDPEVMPVMLGFGAGELSVAAARVGQVREWVRGLDFSTCETAAARLLDEARDASRERV